MDPLCVLPSSTGGGAIDRDPRLISNNKEREKDTIMSLTVPYGVIVWTAANAEMM